MNAKNIGRIEIYDDYSMLDMPADLPPDLLDHLKKVWVAGQQLNITRDGEAPAPKRSAGKRPADKGYEGNGGKKPHRKGPPKNP
jgi:ATP-dependent RNA helicase DeaD